mmetsp:Transcript_19083/g.62874  ORF Transcript_19083/g.62874 Transcript_19083/m.62874 type:complete len:627 (-) Transcript_19083:7062-8942(-)
MPHRLLLLLLLLPALLCSDYLPPPSNTTLDGSPSPPPSFSSFPSSFAFSTKSAQGSIPGPHHDAVERESRRADELELPREASLINIIPAFEPGWRQHEDAIGKLVNISKQRLHSRNLGVLREALSAIRAGRRKRAASQLSRYNWDDADLLCLRMYFKILSRVFKEGTREAGVCAVTVSRLTAGNKSHLDPHRTDIKRWKEQQVFLDRHDASGEEAVRSYSKLHHDFVAAAMEVGSRVDRAHLDESRFLVCQPTFGLGNRMNAMMMCMTLAMMTGRVLLLHWNCLSCHDELAYPLQPSDVLLRSFVDWNIDLLLLLFDDREISAMSRVVVEPGVSDGAVGGQELSLQDIFTKMNIDDVWPERVLVLNVYRFYPSIFDNPHYKSLFQRPAAAGEAAPTTSFSLPPPPAWYARMGLRLFGSPPAWTRKTLEQASRLVSLLDMSGRVVGLQMRRHLPVSYEGVRRDRESAEQFVTCALSFAPGDANLWVLVTDSVEGRTLFLQALAGRLGCLAWAVGSDRILKFAERSMLACSAQEEAPSAAGDFVRMTSPLGGTVVKLARGDVVLEMWMMSLLPDLVVITEQSSFILPASAFSPKPTVGFSQSSLAPRCRLLKTSEPDCTVKAGRYACS